MSHPTPLRVLFLGKDAGRGGMQRELLSIVQFLNKEKFTPLVLLQEGGEILPLYKRQATVEVYSERLQAHNRHSSPRIKRWLPPGISDRIFPEYDISWASRRAQQFKPDVIVRQYMIPLPAFHALENSPLPSLQILLMNGAQTERMDESTLRRIAQHTIIYPGHGVGRFLELCLGVEPTRTHKICTGLDLSLSQQQLDSPDCIQRRDLGIGDDDLVIAACGGIIFLKGVDLWLEAAVLLRTRFPNRKLKFLWIGGSDYQLQTMYGQSIQRSIIRYSLQDHVIITGNIQEVYPYDALCDIYVQPSRDDAFPLATCEAMALAKPVVAFPQGVALEDYAKHAMVIVDQVNAQALANGISQLIESAADRELLGAAGRKVIEEHLEINGSMRRYEDVLMSLAQGNFYSRS